MAVHILGIGTARPARSLSRDDAVSLAVERCCASERQARAMRALYRRTTVETRGISLLDGPGEPHGGPRDLNWFYPPGREPTTADRMVQFRRLAPDLAVRAGAAALRDAHLEPGPVTHLVLVTCTGFAAPGLADAVIKRLDLDRGVRRIYLGFMGCHAALNGLQVAHTEAMRDPGSRVLVCCCELCSLHFQYGWHADRIVATALFADGAAAVVVGQARRPARHQWRLVDSATRLFDGTEDDMTWHIGDHGFVMRLSPSVPQKIASGLRPWLDDWLDSRGLSIPSIGSWAIHAGGPRIVSAVAERLDVGARACDAGRAVLRRCGNMSSATVLFILEHLRNAGAALPCVALSFGPGLVAEATLLDGDGPAPGGLGVAGGVE